MVARNGTIVSYRKIIFVELPLNSMCLFKSAITDWSTRAAHVTHASNTTAWNLCSFYKKNMPLLCQNSLKKKTITITFKSYLSARSVYMHSGLYSHYTRVPRNIINDSHILCLKRGNNNNNSGITFSLNALCNV